MKNDLDYIKKFINQYPQITSGRKNYRDHQNRILKNINLVKKFINKAIKKN